jgi:tetratricopeptide (TPR) repeat protein
MRIEENKKLSESILWDLQIEAYKQFGPSAWAKKGVPFYLTSNPLIAKQFSHVILGFLRDCIDPQATTPIDFSEPVYLFDLGAGSGRFGYLCIKHLLSLIDFLFPRKIRLKYVMTDISDDNIAFWQKHPSLQPYIHRGTLDFACYHHTQTKPLELIHNPQVLTKENVKNPIILICTYFFDTISQDLFRVKEGKLEEGRITLTTKEETINKNDPALIETLEASYEYYPISLPEEYYPNQPELNKILKYYVKNLKEGSFLLPIGSFQSLQYFSALSRNRFFLLAGDQGVCTEEQIQRGGEPKISKHSSFSIAVNYHAIVKYLQQQQGFGWLTHFSDPKFVVLSGGLRGEEKGFPEAHLAFREQMDAFEPVHYWKLTDLSEEIIGKLTCDQLLILVQLGNWDPIVFHNFFTAIRNNVAFISDSAKNSLARTILHIWEHFYPIDNKEGPFIMNLGVILFEIGHYNEALYFFKKALEMIGEERDLLMNIAKCYRVLGDYPSSLLFLHKASSYYNS